MYRQSGEACRNASNRFLSCKSFRVKRRGLSKSTWIYATITILLFIHAAMIPQTCGYAKTVDKSQNVEKFHRVWFGNTSRSEGQVNSSIFFISQYVNNAIEKLQDSKNISLVNTTEITVISERNISTGVNNKNSDSSQKSDNIFPSSDNVSLAISSPKYYDKYVLTDNIKSVLGETNNVEHSDNISVQDKTNKKILNENNSNEAKLINSFVNETINLESNIPVVRYDRDTERKVSVLGLFELSTAYGERPEGNSELAAAMLAVKHINERKLLPGYSLELLTNDTKCDPGVGVDRFFHALYTQKSTRMVMLLGSACSEVTESLAKVVPYWNIVQVSFGSTSPALSDRREFPLFYRTVAPDSSHNPARIAFIRRFGWDTVSAFSQNEEVHALAVNDLVTELERSNITCAATITFADSDFKDRLRLLRDLDTRIIIGSFSHNVAPKIFCEAYRLGMFGADYAWLLQGPLETVWWSNSSECPDSHLAAAVEKLIIVSSHNSIVGSSMSYSGLTNAKFRSELGSPASRYAPQAYDAVWAIALALRAAEESWTKEHLRDAKESKQSKYGLSLFDYTRKDMATEFLMQLGRLNFLGVSGPVSFSGADRVGTSAFYQIQDGEALDVALFYPDGEELDFSCPGCVPVKWHSGQVPIAKRIFKLRVETVTPGAFLAITCLASVGITLAVAFLAFNLHFRRLKSIKLSSPRLSNMTAVGCILVYGAVVLLGLDHATLPTSKVFPAVCTARVYLLSAGFSLAFGSMFTKTYRVHRIFTRARGGVCRDRLLQDKQLISLIGALLLVDGLVVTLWVTVDPMERHLRNLTLEISAEDRSVVYQPQVEVCRSLHTHSWLGALYAYKGLLLLVGVYMAWETRHVKIPALNDSQYIGISVYSVVITSCIVVVLANLISERVTLAFVTISTLILFSTTATLCLLFVPKLNSIMNQEEQADPVVHSMGLKIECNTRRFVTDDKRELQYRVEVQNRVYRREMAALDAEISKLEKMLSESVHSSRSNSSASITARHKQKDDNEGIIHHPRTPSIGGGLPMLLLSVLPPVIPRASWPSAQPGPPSIRRSVCFSSQPGLDDAGIELIRNCWAGGAAGQSGFGEKRGFLDKIRSLFGVSRPVSRKTSGASLAGNSTGIASALKVHMGVLAGLVPGAGTKVQFASCNTLNTGNQLLQVQRRPSFAKSGPTINILPDEEQPNGRILPLVFSVTNTLESEKRKEIITTATLHTESSEEKSKHRDSLDPNTTGSSPMFSNKISTTISMSELGSDVHVMRQGTRPRCRSMEDASLTLPGSRRGSGLLAVSWIPSDLKQTRPVAFASTGDVWADAGIPLSELENHQKRRKSRASNILNENAKRCS